MCSSENRIKGDEEMSDLKYEGSSPEGIRIGSPLIRSQYGECFCFTY